MATRCFASSSRQAIHLKTCWSSHWEILRQYHNHHLYRHIQYDLNKLHTSPNFHLQWLWRGVAVLRHLTTLSPGPRAWDATSSARPECLHSVRRHKTSDRFAGEGLPELTESDLEETFTHGHGPGGQSVNKTTNCCVLRHIPTGVSVKVHETRSLDENRKFARLRLRQRLDLFYNGKNSKLEIEKRQNSIQKREKKKRTNQRLDKLRAFKDREGLS